MFETVLVWLERQVRVEWLARERGEHTMNCFHCEESARGGCTICGIALCKDHGSLVTSEESLPTENSLQRTMIPIRSFLCEFDQEQLVQAN